MPGQIGLAGFNGLELLDGLPRRLATMQACRLEIGREAARIVAAHAGEDHAAAERVVMTPELIFGDTLKRR